MSKKVTEVEQAIKILSGAVGITVSEKTKVQSWSYGRKYSEKVVNAGKFLDQYKLNEGGNFKTVWLDGEGEHPVWGNKNSRRK